MRSGSSIGLIVVFAVLIFVIIAGSALLVSTQPEAVQIVVNPPVPTATPGPTATPEPISIYVTGAVTNPETTVSLPAGSRVQDAIDAAGGTVGEIDAERVNPIGMLRDGDHVHIFAIDDPVEAALPTPGGNSIIAINTATLEELDTLPGIGPALAQRIIDYRVENGPFANLEALDEVSGIGPAMLEDLTDLISFE